MARVKRAVKIPVIANGDVHDAQSALDTLRETGCDGVMIGRGALGNPFVFEEIVCALDVLADNIDPAESCKAFRVRMPSADALLRNRGLK